MSRIPLLFLTAAALCMVVGVALGIAMGMAHDFRFAPVHAHLNLLGWTSLALMGLTYRAWPELCRTRTAAALQFGLSASSAFVFPLGIYVAIAHGAPALAIAAALVWFAGAVLFLVRLAILLVVRGPVRLPAAMQPAE
jgi:hypothetical protein